MAAGIIAALVGSAAVALSATPATASVQPFRDRFAYSGIGAHPQGEDYWATWRNEPVTIRSTWNDHGDHSWAYMTSFAEQLEGYAGYTGPISLAQPMWAQGDTVTDCASGARDTQITAWANSLASKFPNDVYIRLGWEFNGAGQYWWNIDQSVPDVTTKWKNCWVHWYDIVKAAKPNARFVWNPNFESWGFNSNLDPRDYWPGAQYVDAAGPDLYARSNSDGTPRSPWQTGPNGTPQGIKAWQAWVADKGVPFAVPEWGVWGTWQNNPDENWFSDHASYVTDMRDTMELAAASATGLAFEAYFDGSYSGGFGCKHSIHSTACPNAHPAAAAVYLDRFDEPYSTGSTPPPTGGTNLALGKYASASSGANPTVATDGNTGTAWSPSTTGWQTWSVDFGNATTVGSVTLRFGGTPASTYELRTSTDLNNWTTIYSTTSGSGSVQNVTLTSPVNARHLQVYFKQGTGYTLTEFEAFAATQ